MTDATDFLTPNDVCNLLGISRVTLDRWIERG
jgi:predicted site-specific integrase-resolvase